MTIAASKQVLIKMLQTLPRMSEPKAQAIAEHFPTIRQLTMAFKQQGAAAVAQVTPTGSTRSIGMTLARQLACFFTSSNPNMYRSQLLLF
jgi:hypothetical protein